MGSTTESSRVDNIPETDLREAYFDDIHVTRYESKGDLGYDNDEVPGNLEEFTEDILGRGIDEVRVEVDNSETRVEEGGKNPGMQPRTRYRITGTPYLVAESGKERVEYEFNSSSRERYRRESDVEEFEPADDLIGEIIWPTLDYLSDHNIDTQINRENSRSSETETLEK
jgi:hypothetical protein